MGPKKKKQTKAKEQVQNIGSEQPKEAKEPKQTKTEKVIEKKEQKKQDQNNQQKNQGKDVPKKIIQPLSDHHHITKKKISLDEEKPLTEAERMEQRKLRFNVIGTQIDAEEAEKIRLQRLQKFGGKVPESRETIDKRKQKFGLKTFNDEDQETLLKRRQKFNNQSLPQKEDQDAIKKRKQKFGGNDITLDNQIKKGRQKNNFKRSRPKHMSREKYYANHKKPKWS